MPMHLVFGAGGQLGKEIVTELEARDVSVAAIDRETCDITSPELVRRVMRRHRPEIVFNAAAYTDIDQAESLRKRALQVNGIGAGIVAAACNSAGARLVHFSSSYVFGAGHQRPIDEARAPEPMSNYGKSELWGEELVARNCPRSFIIRSSALYSRFGNNIVSRITEAVLHGKESITAIEDEIVSPTPASLVARKAMELADTDVYGTYHASSSGACSWYEFLSAVIEKMELDVEIHAVTQERWAAAARRPLYSALDNLMLRTLGLDTFPSWEESLDVFIDQNGEQMIWQMS